MHFHVFQYLYVNVWANLFLVKLWVNYSEFAIYAGAMPKNFRVGNWLETVFSHVFFELRLKT